MKLAANARKTLVQRLIALYLDGKGSDARQHMGELVRDRTVTEDDGREILLEALVDSTMSQRFR